MDTQPAANDLALIESLCASEASVIKLLLAIDERYRDVATAEVLMQGVISKKEADIEP